MGQAKARKVEISQLKSTQSTKMTAVEFIETIKKVVAEKYNWTDSYTGNLSDKDNTVLTLSVIMLAKSHNVTAAMIQDAYPNMGTYTYTDGVVDQVLGALHPMSRMLMDMHKSGISFAFTG